MDKNIVGYVNAGEYENAQQAYDDSEGWVRCIEHTKELILDEFQKLSDEYDETHDEYRPKDLLAWVLARYKGMDGLFEITKDMVTEDGHAQCYECYEAWADDLHDQSMKDAVARWEDRYGR
jgi:hypothetical protein